MDRVVELAQHFGIPASVCINKFDLNPDMTQTIEEYAGERGLPVVGRIPFDPVFTEAMVQKQTIIEYNRSSEAAQAVKGIWERLTSRL
jgi:MinD superfamily P-loop ATPase